MNENQTNELIDAFNEKITIQKNRIITVKKNKKMFTDCEIYLLAKEEPLGIKTSYEDTIKMVWG